MSDLWWSCHWCDWEARSRRRVFDRYRAKLEFRRHLQDRHPGIRYNNEALWGNQP